MNKTTHWTLAVLAEVSNFLLSLRLHLGSFPSHNNANAMVFVAEWLLVSLLGCEPVELLEGPGFPLGLTVRIFLHTLRETTGRQ